MTSPPDRYKHKPLKGCVISAAKCAHLKLKHFFVCTLIFPQKKGYVLKRVYFDSSDLYYLPQQPVGLKVFFSAVVMVQYVAHIRCQNRNCMFSNVFLYLCLFR